MLLVVLNTGDCYMLETQSERFMEFPIDEEMKDIDKRSTQNAGSNEGDVTQETAGVGGKLPPASPRALDKIEKRRNVTKKAGKSVSYDKNHVLGRISPEPVLDL